MIELLHYLLWWALTAFRVPQRLACQPLDNEEGENQPYDQTSHTGVVHSAEVLIANLEEDKQQYPWLGELPSLVEFKRVTSRLRETKT